MDKSLFYFSLCFQVKILSAPEAPPPPLPASVLPSVHPSLLPSWAAHTSMSLCFPAAPAEELWKWKSAAPTARSPRAVRTRRDRSLVRLLTLHHHRTQLPFPISIFIFCIFLLFDLTHNNWSEFVWWLWDGWALIFRAPSTVAMVYWHFVKSKF